MLVFMCLCVFTFDTSGHRTKRRRLNEATTTDSAGLQPDPIADHPDEVHDPELDSVWETTHTADICL
jgi:hypothetical protein